MCLGMLVYAVGFYGLSFLLVLVPVFMALKQEQGRRVKRERVRYTLGNNGWPLQSKQCIVTVRPFIVIRTVLQKVNS